MRLEHLRNPGDFLEGWIHHPDLFPKADRQGYGCRALRPALLLPRPGAPCQAPPPTQPCTGHICCSSHARAPPPILSPWKPRRGG